MDWHYSLSGLLVGVIVGMTGVGGGSLMTPLLVMVFGVSPATAIGTDLVYAGLTKAAGSVTRHRLGSVNWRVAALLAIGSVPAALATTWMLSHLVPYGSSMGKVLTVALGGALVLSALALVFKSRLQRYAARKTGFLKREPARHVIPTTILVGALLGVLVTTTSVGAGALCAIALLLLYPQLPTNHIAGTDIVHAVPLTLVAGAGHAFAGTVDYGLLGTLLIGSLPGIVIGSLVAHRLPEPLLRQALAAVLFAVGCKLVI
ncbi:MAG TPA: sulfite exporter TauE/SafE family protein [Burkholderiales bacterium]|nr:sulfite exporter TauE/SafE family protein [Burkholderiales bacterium]